MSNFETETVEKESARHNHPFKETYPPVRGLPGCQGDAVVMLGSLLNFSKCKEGPSFDPWKLVQGQLTYVPPEPHPRWPGGRRDYLETGFRRLLALFEPSSLNCLPVMTRITQLFESIGAALDSKWRAENYVSELFSENAERALQQVADCGDLDLEEIFQWVFTAPELPRQFDLKATFSQPPLTVFANERFHIAFLFWTSSTTAIHEHSFEGAFQVFHGSSIQATYGFRQTFAVSEHLSTGVLRLKDISHLRKGDIRRIDRGSSFIHSLYHLDHPSVTLIIRTNIPRSEKQWSYEYPGIALDPFHKPERLTRILQFLTHLNEIEHPDFEKFASSGISASSPFDQYQILSHLSYFRQRPEIERLAALTGSLTEVFKAALKDKDRMYRLVGARTTVRDDKRRLFLALLLNIPKREEIVKLLAKTLEQDPEEFIKTEVAQLCRDETLGISDEGLTGHVVRGLLASPVNESGSCFKNTAFEHLADEVRNIFRPLFSLPHSSEC